MNPTPQIVAVFLVRRLISAVLSRMRKTVKMPMGMSISPFFGAAWMLSGTRYCRGERSLSRRKAMDMVMKTNDQMTPKA